MTEGQGFGSVYAELRNLNARIAVVETGQAGDRATMHAHLKSCEDRSQHTNEQLGELQRLVVRVQWFLIGGLATVLAVVLGHDLLHIG